MSRLIRIRPSEINPKEMEQFNTYMTYHHSREGLLSCKQNTLEQFLWLQEEGKIKSRPLLFKTDNYTYYGAIGLSQTPPISFQPNQNLSHRLFLTEEPNNRPIYKALPPNRRLRAITKKQ